MEKPTKIEQKLSLEVPDSEDNIAVSLSPIAVPPATAAAPSTSWLDWLPSFGFLSSSNPTPVSEEERQQQILERQALEAAVLSVQEGSDDDFVSVDASIEQAQVLKAQEEEAATALEMQQRQQAQDARALEAQQEAIETYSETRAQTRALEAQQEAIETYSQRLSNLQSLLDSASPASPAQTEQAAIMVPGSEANAPPPFSSPIDPELDPHPGAILAMQTATDTQTGETKEADEQAEEQIRMEAAEALEAAQRLLLEEQAGIAREEKARQDVLRAAAEEQARIAREEQARQDVLRAAAEEQARIAREEQARQDVLRAAAEEQARIAREEQTRQDVLRATAEQARIAREERARQNAILLLQQQQQLEQRQQAEIACQQQAMIEHRKKQAVEAYRIGF